MLSKALRFAASLYIHVSNLVLALLGRRGPYGVLTVELSGDLAEAGSDHRFLGLLRRPVSDYLSTVTLLRWAREDPRLAGVLVRCDDLRVSWARIQELRRSLVALRGAGKRVWVYLERAGAREYCLASAAERIVLAPAATLDVAGLSSEAIFLGDALEKAGVHADVVQAGRFKSAGEMFTRRDLSAPAREMLESLVDDLYDQLAGAVAEGRGIDAARARDLLGQGPYVAAEAVEAGLVDTVGYADEAEAQLVAACGGAAAIERGAYEKRRGREMRLLMLKRRRLAKVAVLHIGGTIKPGESLPGPEGVQATGAATVVAALDQIRKRRDLDGLVVRVSSPGGSVLGSDLIWRALKRAAEAKPVVVSCGDVAASGGYYVALAGAMVLAEAGTLTGSIGVIAGKASLRRLYERLGVNKELIGRGLHAGMHSDFSPLDDDCRARLGAQADAFYRDFLGKVAAARNLDAEAAAAAAEGRVWTGRQALERSLVDGLGGIEDALSAVKRAVGVGAGEPIAIERFPKPRRLWRLSVDLNIPNSGALAELAPLVSQLAVLSRERLWAILPFHLRFF